MFLYQYEHPSYTFLLIEENKNFFYMRPIIIVIFSYLELLFPNRKLFKLLILKCYKVAKVSKNRLFFCNNQA